MRSDTGRHAPRRATRDADLLGFGASDPESVAQVFREIAAGAVAVVRQEKRGHRVQAFGGWLTEVLAPHFAAAGGSRCRPP